MDTRRGGRGGLATAGCASRIARARFAALVALRVEAIRQRLMVEPVRRKARDVVRICLGLCGRESNDERGVVGRR
jgi:hypothetical protein